MLPEVGVKETVEVLAVKAKTLKISNGVEVATALREMVVPLALKLPANILNSFCTVKLSMAVHSPFWLFKVKL